MDILAIQDYQTAEEQEHLRIAAPTNADTPAYAIREYPDMDAIYARLDALVRQPLRSLSPEKLAAALRTLVSW